jgi:hypothetical protein
MDERSLRRSRDDRSLVSDEAEKWCRQARLAPATAFANPQETLWDAVREKIFRNYALKSMDDVHMKLDEAALYLRQTPNIV